MKPIGHLPPPRHVRRMSKKETPFEGLLGNTSELRLLEHLMSLPRFDFNISELSRVSGVTRPPVDKVVKKFVDWEIMEVLSRRGNMTFYKLNEASPIVQTIVAFNNALIQKMFPESRALDITMEHAGSGVKSDASADVSEWDRPWPYIIEDVPERRAMTTSGSGTACQEPVVLPRILGGGAQ